ncbi:DUF3100 domain-containing protein [Streptomyces xanthii]|uniref:DUF3100 domain-containing protein n=1 Tax=Streptomyces xanthii TaxID=2768069 RepID=A0A7H1BFY1_9ACTN|nr:DUF3100 domain-containing protein [Streptomyces xanthii]QNS07636.1 DUF3100 domain-containing protein [Streptomyces xanthii]
MSTDSTLKEAAAVSTSQGAPAAVRLTLRDARLWVLIGFAVVFASAAQAIGPIVVPVGVAAVTLLPMIWGLLAGGITSGQRIRPLPVDLQQAANVIMGIAVLVLGARLAFTIGPSIPLLLDAGPALLLQEAGHLFGTILVALPLAVLLRMGPATIGATFSIDRETSFAMVSERYGADSPQYRGVLSMYVYGTIFGALVVSLVASLAASLGIFDPRALAMGSGIGSSSMMAAGAASIVAVHPEMSEQALALASTSNLITSVLGLYIGVWVSLPLADRCYRLLTRDKDAVLPGRRPKAEPEAQDLAADVEKVLARPTTRVPLWTTTSIVVGTGLVVAAVAAHGFTWSMIACYAVLAALVLAGLGVSRVTRGRLPAIVVVITLGALLTSPVSPVAGRLSQIGESVDILSVITMLLTIAGLSLGKDLPMLKKIGWKIVPVGTTAIIASFVLSTVAAEFALGLWG